MLCLMKWKRLIDVVWWLIMIFECYPFCSVAVKCVLMMIRSWNWCVKVENVEIYGFGVVGFKNVNFDVETYVVSNGARWPRWEDRETITSEGKPLETVKVLKQRMGIRNYDLLYWRPKKGKFLFLEIGTGAILCFETLGKFKMNFDHWFVDWIWVYVRGLGFDMLIGGVFKVFTCHILIQVCMSLEIDWEWFVACFWTCGSNWDQIWSHIAAMLQSAKLCRLQGSRWVWHF